MMRSGILTMIAVVFMMPMIGTAQSKLSNANIQKSVLWEQGKGKYKNYRIPAVVVTKKGTVLAFCEAREAGDTGDIDLLVKRSKDNGKTWSEELLVWNDEQNTCGNPCPVVDMETGRIWMVTSWNDGKDGETAIVNKTSRSPRLPLYVILMMTD
ncbi:exo-alpha-sialidase [Niabella hibiscisoli]|uniref:exo-alpha-sialidase n=1 Tax=Niabella hibiscisoli TaxID=1825928 RepID=UPI0021D40B1D|nr:sialidase family protein [Niabella hibiscisoli]